MVILLYGPDTYERSRKLLELRTSILERNPLITQGSFDLEEPEQLYALHEFAAVSGLFSQGKRIAIVRNPISLFGNETLRTVFSRAADDSDVVLVLHENRDKKLAAKEEAFC